MPPLCIDGNEAVARVAYALSEAVTIYPITPASPMGEHADAWAAAGRRNLWGAVPSVIEMQSEGGAAGALHGAIQAGALGVTFTASQGLLLMLPNMFKIAGELTPTVIHVAARTLATHALSIFGDHSDVMAARTTGWTMLASATPQEAQDLAAVSHAATLASRVPVMHFFDGFRTSHELAVVDPLTDDDLRALLDEDDVVAHRLRSLDPDRPVLRGTAQNPDVFFQAREAANRFHDAVPGIVQTAMDRLAERTGRRYHLIDYHGVPDAERVVVLMGSGSEAVREVVDHLVARGERVGVVIVRLFRPLPTEQLLAALPETATRIAVLDRTKEPGAPGEPLHEDVVQVLADAVMTGHRDALPDVIGGRYGLSSKEFTPAMVAAVFAELAAPTPKRRFTVGIVDDVTHLSLPNLDGFELPRPDGELSALFFGLGSDGTVSANKNTAKIVAENTDDHVQAYFVYDSKKSGATTVSHLRFSPQPIRSTYLIERADLVACHQFGLLEKLDVLAACRPGGTVLLNAPFPADQVWGRLPADVQEILVERGLRLFVIDGYATAREAGLGGRISTVMQVAFFVASGVLLLDEAIAAVEAAAEVTYAEHGPLVVSRNLAAIRAAGSAVHEVQVPHRVTSSWRRPGAIERALELRPSDEADLSELVQRVTARIIEGDGELLPVSALPVDGTFETGTARLEKRSLANELPIWDPGLCIDCGKCAIVCPHAAIQIKVFEGDALDDAPDMFLCKPFKDRDLTDHLLTVQVAPDDCTGCGVCVEACPAVSKSQVGHQAIDMEPAAEHRDRERDNFRFFQSIPYPDRTTVRQDTVKHTQTLQPLFEFSGACAGCGETPYLKLMTQLFGDRTVVANATGCSSIYGGNLPTTPWGTDAAGRGPAWSNSLFEDNAEFGLGIRVGLDEQRVVAEHLLGQLAGHLGGDLVGALLAGSAAGDEAGIAAQRDRVAQLRQRLADAPADLRPAARQLEAVAGVLVRRDVWIVGGDGWAYDIGFGGLDHVLASGADVNVLVLDTEVYSNTGGQSSKATPRGAVAKFATSGKATPKKDLGLLAMQYGTVYVAKIALGADERQTIKAFREAESWPGPSLLLAYSTCIAHGVDMRHSMGRMDLAVKTGYWPLFRFQPDAAEDTRPFRLDSKPPSVPLEDFLSTEGRYAVLERSDPERAAQLRELAARDVDERWRYYEQLAGVERHLTDETEVAP
ncbi:pyruvate:ferredoxin (flavodoxin) oxidoreductase [Nitriliruptor alkaliphilus]|uniref:pyruvate:ferredoxin (flavodoxin) oxidoreductase n=1 Tax=Nitriliruptor alkaliphilus TaxID=427918 RepID=UPI000AFAC4CC|nr:pyruvate:ferredoxin (flavodoxin) oxidoreductase [Nitriliruptor alkaliphilus]